MFILLNTYSAPLERIDELIPEHRAWVKGHFAAGRFLFGGRRIPRTGGFVVAAGDDVDEMDRLLAEDPLVRHQVVEWTPIHVEAQFTNSDELRRLLTRHGAPTETVTAPEPPAEYPAADASPTTVHFVDQAITIEAGITLAELADRFGLPWEESSLEVDRRVVPREEWSAQRVPVGAQVTVVKLAPGG
ncbi:hypothetical protein E1298_25270 [Actinomadura rubrisoli]|uniref:YCII-related domain-containing protein n=1 Tax=Actinomadura rubrisoli TaxID=2530368 RepID=A0A4R5B647_9ACTN|nr:hypothetical protein E1298_25270 [Actinomadura rubrisoli]